MGIYFKVNGTQVDNVDGPNGEYTSYYLNEKQLVYPKTFNPTVSASSQVYGDLYLSMNVTHVSGTYLTRIYITYPDGTTDTSPDLIAGENHNFIKVVPYLERDKWIGKEAIIYAKETYRPPSDIIRKVYPPL